MIFFAVLIGMMSSGHPDASKGFAPAGVAVVVVFILTVIPWLIFMMFKQAISDFRRWRSKAARVNAGPAQLLNDGISSPRIARDRGARVIE